MYSIFLGVNVKPTHADAFADASIVNGRSSVEEEPVALSMGIGHFLL